jgi:hypothetical protein
MTSLHELEPAVWSEKQFGACEPGDARRTQRLVRYAGQSHVEAGLSALVLH